MRVARVPIFLDHAHHPNRTTRATRTNAQLFYEKYDTGADGDPAPSRTVCLLNPVAHTERLCIDELCSGLPDGPLYKAKLGQEREEALANPPPHRTTSPPHRTTNPTSPLQTTPTVLVQERRRIAFMAPSRARDCAEVRVPSSALRKALAAAAPFSCRESSLVEFLGSFPAFVAR